MEKYVMYDYKTRAISFSDRTVTVPGLVPDRNKVDSVRARNIFCSGAGPC